MRKLEDTLPSPSELDNWNTCQFKWLMENRQGWVSRNQHTPMLMGRAVSEAMILFYEGRGPEATLEAFEITLMSMVSRGEAIQNEKWLLEANLTREVLKEYVTLSPDRFGKVVGVQVDLRPPEFPLHVKMDLVCETESGRIRIVDQKLTSGWTDIEYENLKYEMGSQPGLYALMGRWNGWDVEEVVIDYLIKGKPASGRYKATLPQLDTHAFPIEQWKESMALASALAADKGMLKVEAELTKEPSMEICHIPRRVINCIKKFGNKSYPCDFYAACSYNVHPSMLEDSFIQIERR